MTTLEKQLEQKNKILKGLEKSYENLLNFKIQKNSVLVVQKNGQIQRINAKELK